MSSTNAEAGPSRAYGAACLQCRTRKRKCEPTLEGCVLCDKDGQSCVRARKRRTSPARKAEMTRILRSFAHADGRERPSVARELVSEADGRRQRRLVSEERPGTRSLQLDAGHSPSRPFIPVHHLPPDPPRVAAIPSTIAESPAHLTPALSAFAISPVEAPEPRPMAAGHGEAFTRAMDDFVLGVCGNRSEEPNELLLCTYFAWQSPQHMPVNEVLFRRDMAKEPPGPYFSRALLLAIHAQASRHILSRDEGWAYADKALALIMASLSSTPTIPTIQTLLILAGRDLALGQASSGWLKCGMALRMILDLGMDADVLADEDGVPADRGEEMAMRKQLFWSGYSWDMFFALTLGRQPTFPVPQTNGRALAPPLPRTPSDALWIPIYADGAADGYTPQLSYERETFHASCLLYQEIEAIIRRLYVTGRQAALDDDLAFVSDMNMRLIQWRHKVTPQILLDSAYLPPVSPPPHIMTLNILYRTAWILLRRPLINTANAQASQDAQLACVAKSAEIHALFQLHEASFNLRNITYLLAYMAYVTATIDVGEALCADPVRSHTAAARLELTLRVLTQAALHTPGIQRSIHHLRQKLLPARSVTGGTLTPTTAHPSSGAAPSAQDLTSALVSSAAPPAQNGLFADLNLGFGFDELFATLQPEFDMGADFDFLSGQGSTAQLPIADLDWLGSVG